jgi:hypothetical protein
MFESATTRLISTDFDRQSNTTVLDEYTQKHSVVTQSIIICFYSIIFLVGLIGNSLVVFVVCRNKTMQSVTNVFITNLAMSDILM